MIQYAENQHRTALMEMWKLCFPQDTDEFIDLYFREIYREEESLIAMADNRPVAFLQMIPYEMKVGNERHPGAYLSGVMTHPDYRNREYMRRLLLTSFDEMTKKGVHYTFLIPQEEKLTGLYTRYGFEPAFPEMIPHRKLEDYLRDAYIHRFQVNKSLNAVDLKEFYPVYKDFLTSFPNVILKTEKQLETVLRDFFNEQGVLIIHEFALIFEKATGEQIRIQKYSDQDTVTNRYKGMIKSLDGSMPPNPVYMIQMLD